MGFWTDVKRDRTIGAKSTGSPVFQCINFAPRGVWELWEMRHRSSWWRAARLLAAGCGQKSVERDRDGQSTVHAGREWIYLHVPFSLWLVLSKIPSICAGRSSKVIVSVFKAQALLILRVLFSQMLI